MIETVLREQMRVALPDGHRLCAQASVRIPDLQGEPMILYPNLPLPGLAQQVMQAFAQEGTPLQIEQEVEDVLTAVALVAEMQMAVAAADPLKQLRVIIPLEPLIQPAMEAFPLPV